MKTGTIFIWASLIILGVFLLSGPARFANDVLAPLFLDSRIERLGEKNLPMIRVEKGGIIYCRMKADDFRFPLPPGSRALHPVITEGGFDTVDGSVEARFEGTNQLTATAYERWLSGRLQVGAYVKVQQIPNGLLITFYYFGDK